MKRARIGHVVVALLGLSVFVALGMADIVPPELEAVVAPGQCIEETKTVTVPEIPPKVDVVFALT